MFPDQPNFFSDPNETNWGRYERLLANGESIFFDEEAFADIISHYMEKLDFQKANTASQQALEIYPNSYEISSFRIQALLTLGEEDEALELLEHMQMLYPKNLDLKLLKISHKINSGLYEEALEELDYIFDEDEEGMHIVHFQMSTCYLKTLNVTKAIYHLEKSIEGFPDNHFPYQDLAEAYFMNDDSESYFNFVSDITERMPFCGAAWYGIGYAHSRLGAWEKAIDAYDYAVGIDPSNATAWLEKGHAHMNSEEYKLAQEAYLMVESLVIESADLLCHIGASFEDDYQYDKGLQYFKRAKELDANWHEALFGMASCFGGMERHLEAIFYLKEALKIQPENSYYWLELAENEAKLGNIVSAEEAYDKAVECDDTNEDAYICWAMFYFNQENYDMAIDIMNRALDEMPDEPDFYYRMVLFHFKEGTPKEAINYLEIALQLDYDGHTVLFEYFTDLNAQKMLYKIIEQYKP
jgi:tetratricopeptide (TPR) repeat protein